MLIFRHQQQLRKYLSKTGGSIAFVPTMGALHQGHLSLISEAKKMADLCVSSIFVNPVQFNDPNDFRKYPKTIDRDIRELATAGCDVLYLPDVSDIYPDGTASLPRYELGYLETVLEGASRPGHFQGVCVVVDRLLQAVKPHMLLLGQKDYQQCMVIQQMTQTVREHRALKLIFCPTVREKNGLAMSSRNMRLSPAERENATAIYHALNFLRHQLHPGSLQELTNAAKLQLEQKGLRVDYICFANARNLEVLGIWDGQTPLVALAAAYMGEVRLIDNMRMNP